MRDMLGLSSMNSGASFMRPMVVAILDHCSSLMVPLRRSCRPIVASAERRRMAISFRPISKENMTVARLFLMAAERAKSNAKVDLPTAGRAAMTIIWPGCRPCVSSSSS
ncbi:hypothetical protein D3C73_1333750 [compost metagenome]